MRKLLTISLLCLLTMGKLAAATSGDCTASFVAGQDITLAYCLTQEEAATSEMVLVLQHAFGVQVVAGTPDNGQVRFDLPSAITNKSGEVSAILYAGGEELHSRSLQIVPDVSRPGLIEAYCGPKHLVTDRNDNTMVVASVLDSLDNPFPESTETVYTLTSRGRPTQKKVATGPLHSFTRFMAPDIEGYGTLTVTSDTLSHTAFRIDFYANDPVDFRIACLREHDYADSEQLVTLETEVMRDRHGNVIGNGTIVHFMIENTEGARTMAVARAVEGRAACRMPAPAHPTVWRVRAEVPYYAKSSNVLSVTFRPSLRDYPVRVDMAQGTLLVGPVTGYMGQYLADATPVQVEVSDSQHTRTVQAELKDGFAVVELPVGIAHEAIQTIRTTISGIDKTLYPQADEK